jgi:hypothetical protein
VPDGCEDDPVRGGVRLQLPLYAEAARQLLGADAVRAVYWYVSQRGGFAREPVELDAATGARFRAVVAGIVDAIEAGVFPATPGEPSYIHGTEENCAYCDYRELCPADRAVHFEAKVDAPELRHWHDLVPADEVDG